MRDQMNNYQRELEDYYIRLGYNIRTIRNRKGISLELLGLLTGLSPTTILQIEAGNLFIKDEDKIIRTISTALEVSSESIYQG